MTQDDKPRKVVGVYDRPASADRRRGPWIVVILGVLVALVWLAYFELAR